MAQYKNFVRLSPEYEDEYTARYGRQPKYIPVDFIPNFSLPSVVTTQRDYSRTWVTNPNYKKK